MTPDPLNRLVAQLAKLPGIGEKTAQRLAFHIPAGSQRVR
ncbi:recombination protein RecR, partial [Stigmatella aurantiaca DW4/3-1]